MCNSAPVISSEYRILAYQQVSFNKSTLNNVDLIIDNISYPLGSFINPRAMRNAFIAQLFALGHIDLDPNNPISDVLGVSVDFNVIGYTMIFNCTQGFHTRIQIKINGGQLPPMFLNAGIYTEFVSKQDGFTYLNVANFGLALGNAPQVVGVGNSYNFIGILDGTTFNNNLATGDNYELEELARSTVINFNATYSDFAAVKAAADIVLLNINAANGHAAANTPYLAALTNADISNAPDIKLYCINKLQVSNQNNILTSLYNSRRQTGFTGTLRFISTDFVQLGLVGNEPIVQLQYFLNGTPKVQLFQYDSLTFSYQPI